MIWNIFWGIYILLFSIGIFIAWYFAYFRKRNMKKLCLHKTTGKIIRYSTILYNNISLPVAEYTVNGQKYQVTGPKFKGTIIYTVSNPLEKKSESLSNLTTREELPEVLKLSFINCNENQAYNPLLDLYPIDSEVDVYYNPNKPKMAYVQRFITLRTWIYHLMLILSIILLTLSLFVMFGPYKIVMNFH